MAYGLKSAVLYSAMGMFLSATTQPMWAAETEWLNIDAEQIASYEYQGKIILISNILLREVSSRHNDELNVLEFKFYAKK